MASKLPSTATGKSYWQTLFDIPLLRQDAVVLFLRSLTWFKKKKKNLKMAISSMTSLCLFSHRCGWGFFCPSPCWIDDSVAPSTPRHVGCYPPPLPSCEVPTLCRVNVAVRSASQFSIRPKRKENISVSKYAIVHTIWFLDVILCRNEEHQKMPSTATHGNPTKRVISISALLCSPLSAK